MFLNQGLFLWSAVPWHRFVLGPEGLLSVAVDRGIVLKANVRQASSLLFFPFVQFVLVMMGFRPPGLCQ